MIPLFRVCLPPPQELMPALEATLYSGYIGQGPQVTAFEGELARWLGLPDPPTPTMGSVLTTSSGTAALQLALRLAGVRGGEVISTPMTCSATNMAVVAEGARLVWADIDPLTGNLDPEDVRAKMTPATRAVVCVDWGGLPCELSELLLLCKERGVFLIEDAAHALGAEYGGQRVGCWTADYTVFSFQAIKHMTTVDGGALIVADAEHYRRGKLLRWYGIDREGPRQDFRCEQDIKEPGLKWHMNDVTACIGRCQLAHLDNWLETRRMLAQLYSLRLGYSSVHVCDAYGPQGSRSAHWLYTVLLPRHGLQAAFVDHMAAAGVQVSRVHARNDRFTAFKRFQRDGLLGVDDFAARMMCLPMHPALTPDEVEQVSQAVLGFVS